MPGALTRLPDSTALTRSSGSAQAGCTALATAHAELGTGGAALAPATGAFGSVTAGASVDLSGLGRSLDGALHTIAAAVPAGVVEQIEGIDREFGKARDLVAGNPLLGLLPEGSALQDVVRQIIAEAIELFERRVTELAESLLGKEELAAMTEGLALIDALRTDYAGHADQLAGFLRSTLLGFDPHVLDPLGVQLDGVSGLVVTLGAVRLAALTDPARSAAAAAVTAVSAAVDDLDPAATAGYARLAGALDAAAGAVEAAGEALRPLYRDVSAAVAELDPDRVLAGYRGLLESLELTGRELVGDVLDSTIEVLDGLVATVEAITSPDDLAARVRSIGAYLHTRISGSDVGQAREQIVEFLGGVRDTIAAVPLAQAREALGGMLERVGQEISDLGLADLATEIETGFGKLADLAATAAREAATAVQGALTALLDQLDALPAAQLVGQLKDAVGQLGGVVRDLHDGAAGLIDDVQAQLDSLTELSFTPVADEVLGEIDELRGRLAAMNPDALSDESKLALRAALAVLEALDVEGKVVHVLHDGYRELDAKVRAVLDDIAAGLDRLHRSMGELNPDAVLKPVAGALSTLRGAVDSLDAAALTTPLRVELDRLDAWLATLKPGRVLSPLQGPYDAGLSAVHRLDPEVWGAPLAGLHAELAALSDKLDLSGVFAELNERRQDLVDLVRDALSGAVDAAGLPEPLAGWFARVLPLVTGVSDLLTLDPGAGMRELSRRVHEGFTLSALYEPLDEVFGAAVATLRAVPGDDLVAAATVLRDGLAGLDLLEPEALVTRVRAAHRRLVDIAPAAVTASLAGLRQLRASFHARVDVAVSTPAGEVARVDARFDAVLAMLDAGAAGSVARALADAQDAALTGLQRAVDGLTGSAHLEPAQQAFVRLRDAVGALVPPQLPRTGPISAGAVIDACEHWRPAARAGELDARLTAFLSALEPAASALEGALDSFTDDLRASAELIDPLGLEPAIAEVFDAVRGQVDALDPTTLLAELRTDVYLPIAQAVEALDPAALATRLETAYQKARTAVLGELSGLVESVTKALEEHLAAVRKAVDELLGEVSAAVTGAVEDLQDILQRVGDLVFGGIVDRLRTVLDNLATSFDKELNRIRQGFDAMLDAAPIGPRIHPGGTGGTS